MPRRPYSMLAEVIDSLVRKPLRMVVPARMRRRAKSLFGVAAPSINADWQSLDIIGPIDRPHVVLDIGAHHGWFFHCWLDWCPKAHIHAFEPYLESFEATDRLYGQDPRVTLHQAGVGETSGALKFNVLAESKVSNSFLAPHRETWDSIGFTTGAVTQLTVPVTTIDEFAASQQLENIYLMKVDVQGYEMHVLRGAEKTLPRVDHIFVEAGIQQLYENAPLFTEVVEFLRPRGFHLMSLRAWHRGNHVLMETDMLFRRNDLAPAVDRTIDRVMERAG
jgi:FkbM family methyltransferase